VCKKITYIKDSIGHSEDEVYLLENKYILKISNNQERLLREKERVDLLNINNVKGMMLVYK